MNTLNAPEVKLTDGVKIPQLGFGVFKVPDNETLQQALHTAVEAGYRSIDTAAVYGNEPGVGRFIRESGLPRSELFITTKLWNADQGYDRALQAFDESLERLGLDYVDLYLIHWPGTEKFVETWRAFEKIHADGRARAIGVSNFMEHHLDTLMESCRIPPMIDQVELHPWLQQSALRKYCKEKGIVVEAWSPLARARFFDTPLINDLARKYDRSPAQICIRWQLQQGTVTIPKSVTPDRIRENAQVFDFDLSEDDMQAIRRLDEGRRIGPHPDEFF
jgi:diketogulonate reductase-like aldo/keto reductase